MSPPRDTSTRRRNRAAPDGFSLSGAAVTKAIEAIPLEAIRAAAGRLVGVARRTPLLPLDSSDRVWLKLENLQPIGSFKIRGAGNAMRLAPAERLARGVVTASAGNMAQGVAWNARALGISCTIVVPDHAPQIKIAAIERLGGRVVKVPFDRWWQTMREHRHPGIDGLFIHPVSDPDVIAGNGTIGLEILEDLPDVDTVLVPFGGGGLSCGIASAIKALRPGVKVLACEVETAAPLAASLASGAPQEIVYRKSFVDGIGSGGLLPEMWPLASRLLDGSLVVNLEEVAAAVRFLAERHRVIAEGAGATPLAAVRQIADDARRIVCVVSGGNIDPETLAEILKGKPPA